MRQIPKVPRCVEREYTQASSTTSADVTVDKSSLSWVNMLLGSLWPKANKALMGFVHNDLTLRLREVLPGAFHRLHFSRFTLGENVPEFGPIEVLRRAEDHVQIELEMRYFSDVDVLLDADIGGLTIGISHLKFAGRLCLSLKPLVETWPVVGGLHVFFCNQPRVEIKFRGLAVVAEFPGFAEKVQDVVDDFFRDRMVLPNCRSYWYTRDERIVNLTEAAAHEPIGVLRVRVLRARNLPGVNWTFASVDRFDSDPYCILKFGAASARTSVIPKTCSPEWRLSEPSLYFVIHHKEQGLEINVASEDNGVIRRGAGVLLGRMTCTSVRTMLREWPSLRAGDQEVRTVRVVLDTSKVNRTMLHKQDPVLVGTPSELDIEVELFELAPHSFITCGRSGYGQDPAAVIMVELRSGSGFPEELISDRNGFRWRCVVEQESMLSKRGEIRKEDAPDFDVDLDPRLYGVVDRLLERGLSHLDIADIVDAKDCTSISRYMKLRQEDLEKRRERLRTQDENTSDLMWYQVLPILVRRPADASLVIELLNGHDMVVGCLKPIVIGNMLMDKDLSLARCKCRLQPPDHNAGKPEGLAAWLFPSCHKPTLARSRYYHVDMEVSVRLRYLTSSCHGFESDARSDNTVTTGLGSAANSSNNGSSSVGSEMRHEACR